MAKRDPWWLSALVPVFFVLLIVPWFCWRTLTAIVDGWDDLKRGKLPPCLAMWVQR